VLIGSQPALSVAMICDRDSRHFRLAVERLRRQTVAGEIELILITPSRGLLKLTSSDLSGFCSCQIVETGPFLSEGAAKANGVRAARAPLIVFCENHSYPAPNWAETLVRRHQEAEYAVVGPLMSNANPTTLASWGCFLIFYGPYAAPVDPDKLRDLPGNNSAYRRDLLLELGERLPDCLQAESLLHRQWTQGGKRLCQATECRAWHMNPSHTWPAIVEYFFASRVFAHYRAAGWGPARRLLYFLAGPGLPFIRTGRAFGHARRAGLPPGLAFRSLVPAFAILCAGTAGEWLGTLLGEGRAAKLLMKFGSGREGIYTTEDLEAVERL
jgi:hypothetical protein